MAVEIPQKETRYVEAVRRNLSHGRLMAVIWIVVMACQAAIIYFATKYLQPMEQQGSFDGEGGQGMKFWPNTYIGMAIGICAASMLWTFWQAVKFSIGGRMDKLLVKYYDQVRSGAATMQDANVPPIDPALAAAIAKEKAAMEAEQTAADKPSEPEPSSK